MVKGAVHRNVSTNAMPKEARLQRHRTDEGSNGTGELCTEQTRRADRWRALLSVVPDIETEGGVDRVHQAYEGHDNRSGATSSANSEQRRPNRRWNTRAQNPLTTSTNTAQEVQSGNRSEDLSEQALDEEIQSQRDRTANASKKKSSSYNCDLCGSTFAEKFNLNKHVRTVHEKKRPFSCHICPVTFKQKDHLKKHVMTVHERKRPFICEICGATFGWVSVLNKHVRSVHEKKRPFECTMCHYSFQQRGHLDKHVLTAHRTSERKSNERES
eukprot:Plantae.Rhodophyta-Purpureofilum_apyrenoidigerum.ctg211.p1 GENE.Plantae.Rhodophyta-Purpureofilum_apyrenoidigerum.ctg211~~Plantae.Rhodophyta-Purpureofilum_apyrenoidigerum.ctg211.p1  ORF type:complete len:271 (+),score=20.93 Plantae.Rhodophyta-Purpureofilum_apyrenoidigerum.ctg211:737-1549(+)